MKLFKRSLFFFSFPLCSLASLVPITTARAQQVIPDNTLGSESSIVNQNVEVKEGILGDRIESGATRGTSLFHSFEKFNVDPNGRVYFAPQSGIQNIFSRVTGGNSSNIQGTLGVLSNANLFFINPNGILFGPNAKLDVGGSFLASTANSLLFGNQFEFSATNKLAPPQLLTVNIPTGLRFRDNLVNTANPVNITIQSSLQIPSGKSLAFVGSDVLLNNGVVKSESGRIELGGVRETGDIGLDGNTLQLNFPDNVARADVQLKNSSDVNVRGGGGGSIAINAKDIEISGNSLVRGGISLSPTVSTGAQAGDVTLNATGTVTLSDSSIRNTVVNASNDSSNINTITGNSGNINIKAGSLSMTGSALLDTSTYGKGNAGNVTVRAENGTVALSGGDIFSNIEAGGDGKGGVIYITAKSLSLSSGAQLQTLVREASSGRPAGRGEAGNVNVQTENDVSLTGSRTRIFSSLEPGSEGKGGNVSITVDKGSLNMSDGSRIIASSYGKGDAGNITVRVENGTVALSNGDIFSNIEAGGDGKGGVIDMTAKSFSLSSGTQLQTLVREASSGRPAGRGEAGNINVRAENDVSLTGSNTRIFSSLETGSEGKGGNVSITVDKGSLNMSDGARIIASTAGKGNAGNITVRAENGTVTLSNGDIFSNIEAGGDGKGGVIDMTAKSFSLSSGTQLQTLVRRAEDGLPAGRGEAGNVNVRAENDVSLTGSNTRIFSSLETGSEGKGGNVSITVDKGSLTMNDGARIIASTAGKGNAGNITVRAENGTVTLSNGDIFSNIEAGGDGKGGVIDMTAKSFSLSSGTQLQTLVREASSGRPAGRGEAGNINVRAENDVSLTGSSTRIFSSLETGSEGKGGNVSITVDKGSLNMSDGARIIASTAGKGNAGNITVRAENGTVTLSNGDIFSNIEAGGDGKGGVIDMTAKSFSLSSGTQLQTLVREAEDGRPAGRGDAGNVNVRAEDGVSLTGSSTRIFSSLETGSEGKGGDVSITVDKGSLSMNDGSRIIASSYGKGDAGNVTVRAENGTVSFATRSSIRSNIEAGGDGKGGNIDIRTRNLSLTGGATLLAGVNDKGKGDAGKITVNTTESVFLSGVAPFPKLEDGKRGGFSSGLITSTEEGANGQGGDINITTSKLQILDGAVLSARSQSNFKGGDIIVNADTVEVTGGGQMLTTSFKNGDAGSITIKANSINLSGSDPTFFDRKNQVAQVFGLEQANFTIDPVSPESGIFANALGSTGNSGSITINAKTFEATNGGQVTTSTSGGGEAGDIIFRVSDRIFISGSNSGLFSSTAENSQGDGGSIDIDPKEMILRDGATISVNSEGSGKGGSIKIGAGILRLDNAKITAETQSAEGGDIDLNLQDLLILRRGSKISATAGKAQGRGDGGDITINIPDGVIIAFPQENSDITANAFDGRGGNISIRGALLGIAPLSRQQLEQLDPIRRDPNNVPTSDITAISQQQPQQEGSVQLNTEIDPNRGLVELPEEVTDPSKEIAQNPCQRGVGSRFIVTGRGGLPTHPVQTVNNNNVQVDLVEPVTTAQNSASTTHTTLSSTSPNLKQFVPAQGWVFNEKGEVVLTAYDPTTIGAQRPLRTLTPTSCAVR